MKVKLQTRMKNKLKNRAGFTLVELLIVVAILGVLAAVAIPAYSAQLEGSKKAVDQNALGSATAMASSDYLLNNYSGEVTYKAYETKTGDTINIQVKPTDTSLGGDYSTVTSTVQVAPQSSANSGKTITIKIKDGMVTTSEWS